MSIIDLIPSDLMRSRGARRHAAFLLALAGLCALYWGSGYLVELQIGTSTISVRSHARSVEAALGEAGIRLGTQDLLSHPLDQALNALPERLITVRPARPMLLQAATTLGWHMAASANPLDVLMEAGLSVYPGDKLAVDGIPIDLHRADWGQAPLALALQPAFAIQLSIDGARQTLHSAASTLGEALWENGIELRQGDVLEPGPETALVGPLQVVLRRGSRHRLEFSSGVQSILTTATTVGDALREAGVALIGLDYSIPAADQPLPAEGAIRIIRVTEQVQVEMQPLLFETLYQPLPEVEIDNQQVVQAGAYGVRASRTRVRLEDGEEVARISQGDWVAQEPTPEILGYGTSIVIRSVATPDGTLEYWRAVQMYATSYSPANAGIPPDHPWYGITASGKPLRKGLVAIDRSLIPFGTMMYVPGYGFAEAADTGGGVKGRWIDLGYEDDEYVPWHQWVTVYFLTPVPPASNIVWIFP